MYFDQMSAIYDHYTVIGSKITIKFGLNSPTTSTFMRVGCFINDDGTVTPTSANALLEHSSDVSWIQIAGGNVDTYTMTRSWSAKKTFGGSVLGNDNLQGTASADPAEQSVYTIFAECNDLSTTSTITGSVEIEFIAVWDELKDIAAS